MEANQVLPDRPAPKIQTTFSGFTGELGGFQVRLSGGLTKSPG